jgi:hypothetical protein
VSSIRVRFIYDSGFISAAIARITGSLFSHVEFGTPEGTWIGAHASGGIKERAADYCKPIREYVYEIPCTNAQEQEALLWMRSNIGTKYNLADIVGLLLQARSMRSPNRLICSQFCTQGLLKTFGAENVLNCLDAWAYRITPETLHLSPIFVGRLVKRVG